MLVMLVSFCLIVLAIFIGIKLANSESSLSPMKGVTVVRTRYGGGGYAVRIGKRYLTDGDDLRIFENQITAVRAVREIMNHRE
jgi:hypothetical protein